MRYTINENTKISELIKEIKQTETSHTFHLSKDLKIVLTALRKCSNCLKWFRNGDMIGVNCWSCYESGVGMTEEPQDYERIDDGGI